MNIREQTNCLKIICSSQKAKAAYYCMTTNEKYFMNITLHISITTRGEQHFWQKMAYGIKDAKSSALIRDM